MSDTKYLSVIHKPTKKVVTAFQFENDATWIGRDKEGLLATHIYCEPNQKIKMILIKTFHKQSGKIVHGYFRAMPGEPKPKNEASAESPAHKKAKENIYSGLYSGEIKINGETLDKSIVKNIELEHRVSSGIVIMDVLVSFKQSHEKYGLGIFFEIQLSKQSTNETTRRHYSRVIEGYTGAWLWRDNFDSDMNYIGDNISVPLLKVLIEELEEKKEDDFLKRINKYGEIIDNKINKYEDAVLDIGVETLKNISYDCNSYKEEIQKVARDEISKIEFKNSQLRELKEIADKLNIKELSEKVDCVMVGFQEKFRETTNIIEERIIKLKTKTDNLDTHIVEKVNKIINSSENLGLIFDRISPKKCPKCNEDMKLGKGVKADGVNWFCKPHCGGFISGDMNYD